MSVTTTTKRTARNIKRGDTIVFRKPTHNCRMSVDPEVTHAAGEYKVTQTPRTICLDGFWWIYRIDMIDSNGNATFYQITPTAKTEVK